MNWNDINIFTLVGETGSFSAAAKQLGIDHSSVSRRMRQLEKDYKTKLFERDGPRVALSLEAERLLATATRAQASVNQFERELKANVDDMSGKIGFSTLYASQGRVMKVLAEFCKTYPNIELDINFSQTLECLNSNTTDVVLRATNNPGQHFIGRKVATNHFPLVANRRVYTPDTDLSEAPWVLWRSRFTDEWMAEYYPNVRCVARVNSAEGMLAAIEAGMGVGHISNLAILRCPDLFRLLPWHSDHDIDFWLLYHQDLRGSRKIKVFVDYLYDGLRNVWQVDN